MAAGPKPRESNATTFYPNAANAQSAAPLNVSPGSELRGVDIKMLTGRMFTIRGKVVNSSTSAAAGLILRAALHQQDATQPLSILNQLTIGSTQTAQDGTFEVRNVTPGTWNVSAAGGGVSVNGAAPARLSGNINVDVGDADVSGVLLQLGPGVSISGRVSLEDGDLKAVFPSLGKSGPTATPITLGDTGGVGFLMGGSRRWA